LVTYSSGLLRVSKFIYTLFMKYSFYRGIALTSCFVRLDFQESGYTLLELEGLSSSLTGVGCII